MNPSTKGKIRRYRRFNVITIAATYLLIFVGGLVRVSGAGLGCPDWPKCFGRWIPPTSASQLPADIDPALFNFTLAWIEYINRLIGVAVGLLILGVAILALKNLRQEKRILYPSLTAALLVAFQGWQGSQVVSSGLEPIIVSLHMVMAFIIVSLLIYAALQAYYLEHPEMERQARYPDSLRKLVGLLWGLTIFQVILGTQVRSGIEHAAARFPLFTRSELLQQADPVSYLHGLFGVLVAMFTWWTADRIRKQGVNPSALVEYGSKVMVAVVAAQIVIGGILVGFGLPNVMQLYHLWTASLFIGVLLLLYSSMKYKVVRYDE
ncbi:MAG TPA: COX15/CtaA family protein [bacterium]|nr:COX15/CtaA family protein [bacterium]